MKKDSVGVNTNLGGVEWHFGNEKDSVGENTNLGGVEWHFGNEKGFGWCEHQPRQC
jgi:hypothetical protein